MNWILYVLSFAPIGAAFLSFAIGRRSKQARDVFVQLVLWMNFALAVALGFTGGEALASLGGVCGMGLNFTADGFRRIYVIIAAWMWLVSGQFSPAYFAHYRNRNRYYLFLLVTLGATQAIFLSADLYTTFVFFEIMSLCSYVWVVQDEKKDSLHAGSTYLTVAVIGGMVLLMGIFLLYHQVGTLTISDLASACAGKKPYAAAICMLVGFGAKAGAYPIHIWLPKAHPVAPAPASALLSGILTKTGIFGILVISCRILLHDELWGVVILLIGVVTMFLGALLALFSVNFKRTLACSSVSQIGFILVGVGMLGLLGEHNALAARGSFLHMVNHSAFKLVLFLTAAVIYQNTHKLELNQIRGFGRKKPLLAGVYLLAALGIAGVPGFSGYISKTLLHESIVEYIHGIAHGEFVSRFLTEGILTGIEWIFLLSGGLTAAYMVKLFVAVFVEKNENAAVQKHYDGQKAYWHPVNAALLAVTAVAILFGGMLPHNTMDALADMAQGFFGVHHEAHAVHYFTWTNLKGSVISLSIGAVVYLTVVRRWMMVRTENGSKVYADRWPSWLDLEQLLYRPLLEKVLPGICGFVCGILDNAFSILTKVSIGFGRLTAGILDILVDGTVVLLRKTIYRDSQDHGELEEGNALTHVIGVFLNGLEQLLNKTIWRHHEHKKDLEHWFVLRYAVFKENATVIGRSLSFGLVLFCIGLCATLIYLLVTAVL